MSMIYPGPRRFDDGDYVRTNKGTVGRVVSATLEHEPTHDWQHWDDELGWQGPADEYMQHVYRVEFLDTWDEPYTEPWPEDLLETACVLDLIAIDG